MAETGPAATAAAGGATPPVTEPPAPPTTPPATSDDGLGDAGKRAIQEERAARAREKTRADDLEAELVRLREATATDSEKAVSTAKRDAAAEERTKWQTYIRDAEVRGALRGAGIANDRMLSLALGAPEFIDLKVADDGSVAGVSEAVDAFKKATPEAFGPPPPKGPAGSPRTGVQPPPPGREVQPGYDRLTQAYSDLENKRT